MYIGFTHDHRPLQVPEEFRAQMTILLRRNNILLFLPSSGAAGLAGAQLGRGLCWSMVEAVVSSH